MSSDMAPSCLNRLAVLGFPFIKSPRMAHPVKALIFLDYDGVIQTPKLAFWREFEYLPALENVLRDYREVGVVLTTTHRLGRNIETLRTVYASDVRAQVIGATPDLICGDADGGRYEEICGWLREEGMETTPWIALDDLPRLYPKNCPQLLRCNPYAGFDGVVEKTLRDWLASTATRSEDR